MSSFLGKVFGAFSGGKANGSSQDSTEPTMDSKPPKKRLFEDDGDDDDDDDDDDDVVVKKNGVNPAAASSTTASAFKASGFSINEDYARRFEHNKKREERQKLEEKYGKSGTDGRGGGPGIDDDDSSSDESEDEDGYLLTEDLDARMTAALEAIKNKDPRIYNTDVKFFEPVDGDDDSADAEEDEAGGGDSAAAEKHKPMFLRDYHRERYLRGDVGAGDEQDAEDDGPPPPPPKTYQQEQDEIKRALIAEMNAADEGDRETRGKGVKRSKKDKDRENTDASTDDDGGGDDDDDIDAFIKPKASSKAAGEPSAASSGGVHPSRAKRIQLSELDVENADKNPELFLSNFLASRAWAAEGDGDDGRQDSSRGGGSGGRWQVFESDDEDDAERDRAEAFEVAYNLRFEDPAKSNEVLKSYSRTVVAERSVRREAPTARQRQRDQERERLAAAKQARREERVRLRKLRIEEAQAKLAKIKQAAGLRGRTLDADQLTELLDGTWDNDAWEAEMLKQFGDEYYAEPDADIEDDADMGLGDNDGDSYAGAGADGDEDDQNETDKKGKSKSKKKTSAKPKKPKWDDDIDITDIVPEFADEALPKIALSDSEAEVNADDNDDDDDDDDDDDQPAAKRRKANSAKARKQDRANAKRDARRERARIAEMVDRQLALDEPEVLVASSRAGGGSASASISASASAGGFRYRETSPQAFGLTARDILLAPSDAALNEFAGLKKLATFRDAERKRRDRKKLGKKARLRQWRRETFGADYEHSGPTYGFEKLLATEGDDADAGSSSSKWRRHGDDKKKSRRDKSPADGGDNDDGQEHKKKKRKRSGKKNKGETQEA